MRQVLIKKGKIQVSNIPVPVINDNGILVEVAYSLISGGTERTVIEKSGRSLIKRGVQEPDKVKKILNILKVSGIKKTFSLVKSKLETLSPTGYSCSGVVIQVGRKVKEIKAGDKVACAGAGHASHAEVILVPENLTVKLPDSCNLQDASSVALGSIAIQGVRRAEVGLGESVAVVGLGLVGQLVVQLLKAVGAHVIGFDLNPGRVNLAKVLGAEKGYVTSRINTQEKVTEFTNGKGVDVAIIAASAPENNEIIQQAMEITRIKGKVVVIGEVKVAPKWSPFYEKEIDLLISRSYGPGRYDPDYEEKGKDYPYDYVRWTEKRNMEEYLRMLAAKKINFQKLIGKIYPVAQAEEAYRFLRESNSQAPAVLLDYHLEERKDEKEESKIEILPTFQKKEGIINVGLIGAGNFAKGMHLPNLKKLSSFYSIYAIADSNGINAKETAKKFGANYCTTDYHKVLIDKDVDIVFITTPHNLHAKMAIEAAKAKKAVFCEKPMALNEKELSELVEVLKETKVPYLVGFNRRFSPAARRLKEVIKERTNPIIVNYRVNAGYLPLDHWTQTEVGGGRIIGETCHMFDLFNFFTEAEVESIDVSAISPKTSKISSRDNFTATLKYTDGSICTLTYSALGSTDLPKEYIEVFCDNKILVIDDFKKFKVYGSKEKGWSPRAQDKGHLEELKEFAKCIKEGNRPPISLEKLISATKISFLVDKEVR